MMRAPECLALYQHRITPQLERYLQDAPQAAHQLLSAMRYANLEGGKRLRAALVYAAAETFNAPLNKADAAAVAVELVHAYSLIHDDLPAMDNSPLRRGMPSCHVAYDHATAILAGDALQALAFDVLANDEQSTIETRIQLIQRLAHASGLQGMAGGQMIDLLYTGSAEKISLEKLQQMHALKTGALLKASILMGCECAELQDNRVLEAIKIYSEALGLAYQIQDDILDVTCSESQLGKPSGQDAALNKMTYPAVIGLEKAKQMRDECYQQGFTALKEVALQQSRLAELLAFVVGRES
jgi:farnesyl diphosphate synthase